jgi:hypothetical protein
MDGVSVNSKIIKTLAADITLTLEGYLKDVVKDGRADFIKLGIDNDIEVYELFFKTILSKLLKVDNDVNFLIPPNIVKEVLSVLKSLINRKGYYIFLNGEYNKVVYDSCVYLFLKVKQDIIKNK